MSVFYISINAVQEQLMKETPESVPDPTTEEYSNFVAYLQNQLIPDVSKYIENYTHRFFVPELATDQLFNRILLSDDSLAKAGYWYDALQHRLYLDRDLLELTTYTSSGDEITSTEYRTVGTPAYALDLDTDSDDIDFDTAAFSDSQDILGWWGYHTDWDDAFTTIESITIDDSATTITVTASNLYKFPQYVRCEDEIMLITALADSTHLTVKRAQRGTTILAHSGKALSTYAVDDALQIAATRMISWLYMQRTSQGNVVQISDNTVLLDQLPTMVKDTLDRLTKGTGA